MVPTIGGLTAVELDHYRRAGYVPVRGRFTADEVAAWQRECDRLWQVVASRTEDPRIQQRGFIPGGSIADRLDPVIDLSDLFNVLTRDERILAPVGTAFGSGPVLVKDKIIAKRPGTMGYDIHQDFPYWEWLGIPADEILTVQVAIDSADSYNGAMEVFPGLHRDRLPPPPQNPLDTDESAIDLATGELISLAAGDLFLFHSLVPHRSAPNRSERSRRALFLTYCSGRHPDASARYNASRQPTG